ncbi:4-hydroxyphenylacetate 3-monooxygenase reductase subunit [Marinithermus hydrothermalis]|uniref:Flavin reductase domain protein FMN-binding protein n=1 Tax=Marinithermus hydrothermalis (strain DSM 14884 / JCM 11576 / T1) TaxID=869210 RepID=F2NK34_MARHT|nr:4-hydroxyphenylacetate 3-monooxygenase reductase subunit [Marinithermus hydrothermalis]AEB12005.1 flavin reductase domain protein FMN-binding protein [Marinithermus hydrothermalis DSM 14884]
MKDRFREALSRWASGVTVLTSRDAHEVRGMTASAFSSVSLEPPLVLVCVDERANILPVIERSKRFVVNLLAAQQAHVSDHFAGKSDPALLERPPFPEAGDPVLEGALASLVCTVWALYPGGDHRIVVGEVKEIVLGDERPPLVYWKRAYRRVT